MSRVRSHLNVLSYGAIHYGISKSLGFSGNQTTALDLGTNAAYATYPVTVEAWIYPTSTTGGIINLQNPSTGQTAIFGNQSMTQSDRTNTVAVSQSWVTKITAYQWHHIAFTMWSSTASTTVADRIHWWVDGVSNGSTAGGLVSMPATPNDYTATGQTRLLLGINQYSLVANNSPFSGFISEVRVSNTARYGTAGATFTVPSAALTSDANTLLLYTTPTNLSTYTITVTNVGSLSYSMTGTDRNGAVSGNNPTLTFKNGDIVDFVVNATGHPFWVKTVNGTGTTNGAPGVNMNNGASVDRIRWTIGSSGTFYYNCQFHLVMNGTITVNP